MGAKWGCAWQAAADDDDAADDALERGAGDPLRRLSKAARAAADRGPRLRDRTYGTWRRRATQSGQGRTTQSTKTDDETTKKEIEEAGKKEKQRKQQQKRSGRCGGAKWRSNIYG